MKPVFMDNDPGGIVFVGKNELVVLFANGIRHSVCINTRELLQLLESRSEKAVETKKYEIEPFFIAPDGCLFVIITVCLSKCDCDKATVFHCDLLEVLRSVELVSTV